MNSTLILPLWAYAQACSFVSPEESRAIRCVHVDAPARTIVATDGHVLLARLVAPESFRAHGESCAEAWNLPAIARLARAKPKARETRSAYLRATRASAASRDVLLAAVLAHDPGEAVDARGDSVLALESGELGELPFPDWRRVMPRWNLVEPRDQHAPAFNPTLLARVAEALAAPRGQDIRPVRIRPFGDSLPAVVEYPEDSSAFAIIMPMRAAKPSGDYWNAPEWARPDVARAAE